MLRRSIGFYLTIVLFLIYTFWWLLLNFSSLLSEPSKIVYGDLFADTYGVLALLGFFLGLVAMRKWGGFSSLLGKSLAFYSFGLLAQFLGQLLYTIIYRFTGIENAYPSIGEVFFVTSVLAYILATWYLARTSGFTLSLVSLSNKITVILVPGGFFFFSYVAFLRGYSTEGLSPLEIFLDFFYPLFQAVFISLGIATYYVTRNVLGGLMRKYVILTILALVLQYIADSLFIYRTKTEVWAPGGLSDYVFVLAYMVMTLSLLCYTSISHKVRDGV